MQVSDSTVRSPGMMPIPDAPRPHRKLGTISVTVRLDPPRCDRLKRLVRRFSTTGRNIIQKALDSRMVSLERERAAKPEIEGQRSFFEAVVVGESLRKPT